MDETDKNYQELKQLQKERNIKFEELRKLWQNFLICENSVNVAERKQLSEHTVLGTMVKRKDVEIQILQCDIQIIRIEQRLLKLSKLLNLSSDMVLR